MSKSATTDTMERPQKVWDLDGNIQFINLKNIRQLKTKKDDSRKSKMINYQWLKKPK